jgi:transposase
MALLKHMEEAAAKLSAASARIDAARHRPPTSDHLVDWLEGLTDYTRALAELQDLNTEAMQETLQEIERRQHQISRGTP